MKLNKYIDHTLLKPEASEEQILKLIEEAKVYDFASICVNPTWIEFAAEQLKGSDVKVCVPIGFPLGANTSDVKAFETKDAIQKGAGEVDMVINVGALKSKDYDLVERDIRAVVEAANGTLVKVILETCLLTKDEIVHACEICKALQVAFVKTSTGFNKGGATVEDVALMKQTVGNIGVKASGGIRDTQTALAMINAGATRIGASAGISIVNGLKDTDTGY